MADFTQDTIPVTSVTPGDSAFVQYEGALLEWIASAVQEGEAILRADPAYTEIDKIIAYIMGDQLDSRRPTALSGITDNRLKNIILQTVAALTDIHPLFGFKTMNDKFQKQSEVLNKLAQAWWVNTFADLKLADVIRYASGPGTGYVEINWDPSAGGGVGDIMLTPRDPRDVLPIRPTFGQSVQEWEGVIIRNTMSINQARARWPERADKIVADGTPSSLLQRTWGSARKVFTQVQTPVDVLTAGGRGRNAPHRVPTVDVYSIYYKDRRFNDGDNPIKMGDPETTWSYTAYPFDWIGKRQKENGAPVTKDDCKLYPGGRLIIATQKAVVYDGPNPYWHGMFPIAKLCLDPWPWSFLGVGIARDLLPIQDAVNEVANGILDKVRKVLRPSIVADKKTVPESVWQRLDTRLPGLKLKTNSTAGKGVDYLQEQDLPQFVYQFLQMMIGEMDNLSGVANLTALTQLNQAPGADSIEKMMEALTPLLRLKGRLLEYFLREMGEMVKSNFFQFYTLPRRVAMLGEAGLDFADFDFDPGTLVPSMQRADPGYDSNYDATTTTRTDRAKLHQKQFAFQITPNSLLAISQLSRKLLYLQLFRGGIMDIWTLFDVLEIPNAGTPPGGAITVTDRLMAMQSMGLGANVSPAGRKASGEAAPQLHVKPDAGGAPRVTVSES